MRIVFMGTPEFAVPTFRKLAGSEHDLIAAVTQPDRPKGRGRRIAPPPVKIEAEKTQIPVFQPEGVKRGSFYNTLKELQPDVIAVVAYGKIVPKPILDLPPLGCVNLHASLLPRFRGAAPMERAIMAGETITGNTTMLMDEGLDTGDILLVEEIAIPPEANSIFLYDRLSESGADLMLRTLDALQKDDIEPEPQDHAAASRAPRLKKEEGLIRWDQGTEEIINQIRGLAAWPVAYTFLEGSKLKLHRAVISDMKPQGAGPGTVMATDHDGIHVSTGNGVLLMKEVQAEGKKKMDAAIFVQGYRVKGTSKNSFPLQTSANRAILRW